MTSTERTISDSDFPALYQLADSASVKAQNFHLFLVWVVSAISLGVAFLGEVYLENVEQRRSLAIVIAALMLIVLILMLVIRTVRKDKEWYNGRAVAESVKSIMWKYVMQVNPYHKENADSKLADDFRDMLKECKEFSIFGDISGGDQITAKMRSVRQLPFDERKKIYIEERLKDQRGWYSRKSRHNANATKKSFGFIALFQLAAFAFACILIRNPDFPFDGASFFVAFAATLYGWMQLKQHNVLAQSYGIAATELGLILAKAESIKSERPFCEVVEEAEGSISREHKLWIAHREVV